MRCYLIHWHPDRLKDMDTVKPILELVRQAAIEGRDVVGWLREFYRVHYDEQFALLDISDLATHVLALTEPKWRGQAQAEGVTIEAVTDLQGPQFVFGDEVGLREMRPTPSSTQWTRCRPVAH